MDTAAATVFTTTLVKIGLVTDRASSDPIVAVPQIAVNDLDVERNVDRIRERVAALPDRVDVAVFPEYALTGFVADERVREAALDRAAALDRLSTAGSRRVPRGLPPRVKPTVADQPLGCLSWPTGPRYRNTYFERIRMSVYGSDRDGMLPDCP